mmetsp:Transcript_8501/g.9806  ORF Transcript_8501/g.9806 Transcript_8501/m.9806 type:complete len:146 (+) Transcript_8501:89-526(+)|eukprot:Skav215151  [mRNA]  locus=scaffold2462:144560:144997:- [translate_table: standard]
MPIEGGFVIEPNDQFFFVGYHGTTMESATQIAKQGFNATNYVERGQKYPAWSGVYLSTDEEVCKGYGPTMLYVYVRKKDIDTSKLEHFYRDYADSDPNLCPKDRGAQERIWRAGLEKLLCISETRPPSGVTTLPLVWGDLHEDGS